MPQNDFQFDPQVFGGYRDTQDNLFGQNLDDTFFNEALDIDFLTPFNQPIQSQPAGKKDLIAQIDAAKDSDEMPAVLKCEEVWYVSKGLDLSTRCSVTNNPTGKRSRTAPRPRTAISTWMVFVPTCKRRLSATASVLSLARQIFKVH